MKINIVSRKLIKPCTPTPLNLKNHNISFIDELSPSSNVCFLLFYPSKPKQVSECLGESLAKILPQFYPLAGRYVKKDGFVDCSDEGAELVEAEAVEVELIDLMAERELEQLLDLVPRQSEQAHEAINPPLLSVQITELKCGGVVMGISVSHKIFDAASVGTFIAAWSNATNPGRGVKMTISPSFESPSLLPRTKQDCCLYSEPSTTTTKNVVVKRFSINMEAITSLRSKLRPNDGKRGISRVRVACALIAKALIGVDRAKYGQPRDCIITQPVDMRERTIPSLPRHSCGNLVVQSISRCIPATETKDIGLQELVQIIGDATDKTIGDCREVLSQGEDGLNNIILNPVAKLIEKIESGEVNALWFTDCTKFGLYQNDFGWGNPVWSSIGSVAGEKLSVLIDNKNGDGIEAWVHLEQNDMSYFQEDELIKLFTI